MSCVNFPPGFLATLSEKTRRELEEKSVKYEYDVLFRMNYHRRIQAEGDQCETLDGQPIRIDQRTVKQSTDGTYIGKAIGFLISEKSFVPSDTLRILSLLEKEKELETLKKSIESIKNAFK